MPKFFHKIGQVEIVALWADRQPIDNETVEL